MINYNGEDYVKFSSAINGIDEVVKEKDKEIERLNNIITELEKWLKEQLKENYGDSYITLQQTLKKLKELKEKYENNK